MAGAIYLDMQMPLITSRPQSIDPKSVTRQTWDAVVIGAGPTGSVAARQTALSGHRVLLIDRQKFPRWKVCGCCLNGKALSVLDRVGLSDVIENASPVRLSRFELWSRRASATLPLPGGIALSRTKLDLLLIEEAIAAGVQFLPETEASLGSQRSDSRDVELRSRTGMMTVQARIVLVCEGLSQRLIARSKEFSCSVTPNSHIGAGTRLADAAPSLAAGTIVMAVGRDGYLGAVCLEDGSVNLAAALSSASVRKAGSIEGVVTRILDESGIPLPCSPADLSWQGTVGLSRRTTPLALERVFVLGDAAGYVEPFTGEGMAWGLSAAVAVAPIAGQAVTDWTGALISEWEQIHARIVSKKQGLSRLCVRGLRHPRLVRGMIGILNRCPALAAPLVNRINSPSPLK